jgi:hypothetical protein
VYEFVIVEAGQPPHVSNAEPGRSAWHDAGFLPALLALFVRRFATRNLAF